MIKITSEMINIIMTSGSSRRRFCMTLKSEIFGSKFLLLAVALKPSLFFALVIQSVILMIFMSFDRSLINIFLGIALAFFLSGFRSFLLSSILMICPEALQYVILYFVQYFNSNSARCWILPGQFHSLNQGIDLICNWTYSRPLRGCVWEWERERQSPIILELVDRFPKRSSFCVFSYIPT